MRPACHSWTIARVVATLAIAGGDAKAMHGGSMRALGANPGHGMTSRGAVGAGVLALHLLALWAFIVAGRLQPPRAVVEPVMTWLWLPDASARAPGAGPARRPERRPEQRPERRRAAEPTRATGQPVPIVAVSPDLPRPTAITPDAVERKPAIDWNAAAVDAARNHLAQQASDSRRDHGMGEAPQVTARSPAPHPAFPWGHQPLGKHVDRQGAIVTLNTKHCTVGLLLFIPFGFGCAPGSIPEPGQGDLFDPKYAPQPLEVPKPLVDDPVHR